MIVSQVKKLCSVLLLVTLGFGCTNTGAAQPSDHYHVYIDPKCPPSLVQDIFNGEYQWEAVGVRYDNTIGTCPTDGNDIICITSGTLPAPIAGITHLERERDSGSTIIDIVNPDGTQKPDNIITAIVMHEIGHSMWLVHTTNPFDLMYPQQSTYTDNLEITADDVLQYQNIRHISNNNYSQYY